MIVHAKGLLVTKICRRCQTAFKCEYWRNRKYCDDCRQKRGSK